MKILILLPLLSIFGAANGQVFGKCFTPDEYQGNCVYFSSCTPLFELFNRKPPPSYEERRFLSLSQCGMHDEKPLVCCRKTETPPPPTPVTQAPTTSRNSLLPKAPDCGIDLVDRIFGGKITKIHEYPWMAMLQYSKPQNMKGFHCGGVLISSRYVITASHCVNGDDLPPEWSLTSVRLGEWDTATEKDCDSILVDEVVCNPNPPVDIPIERKIPHENYDPSSLNQHNDIALLRLQFAAPETDFIRPICLPYSSQAQNEDFVKKTLSVAGWGRTEKSWTSNIKLKVNVEGVSTADCKQTYSSQNREIIDKQICAGGKKGEDSCTGDSGGPLMRQEAGGDFPHWYLAGIVSFGPTPCGEEGWPGVYTEVGKYISWIETNVKP